MKTITAEVKSGRKPGAGGKRELVGTIDISQFDTVDEAVRELSQGEALKLINTQYATNAKNKARANAVGGDSEKSLKAEAFARLLSTDAGTKSLQEVCSDPIRMEALVAQTVAQIKSEKGIPVEDDEELASA